MKVLALLLMQAAIQAQVIVSLTLMPTTGTSVQVGKGLGAYEWSIHVCGLGSPVPWTLVRIEFPEVRFYSKEQQALILQARTSRSLPARTVQWVGYLSAGVGIGLTTAQKINKSPSWSGDLTTIAGLAIPVVISMATKAEPKYTISDPPPDIIALGLGECADYSALAAFGKATENIGPRRIDPIKADLLKTPPVK